MLLVTSWTRVCAHHEDNHGQRNCSCLLWHAMECQQEHHGTRVVYRKEDNSQMYVSEMRNSKQRHRVSQLERTPHSDTTRCQRTALSPSPGAAVYVSHILWPTRSTVAGLTRLQQSRFHECATCLHPQRAALLPYPVAAPVFPALGTAAGQTAKATCKVMTLRPSCTSPSPPVPSTPSSPSPPTRPCAAVSMQRPRWEAATARLQHQPGRRRPNPGLPTWSNPATCSTHLQKEGAL